MKALRARPVLVIDDAEADRDILERAYRRIAPSQTIVSVSGPQAGLDRLAELSQTAESPTLVILDISMPERNGLDLLVEIRREHPLIPVVMLSGSARPDDVATAYRSGAAGYFEKPLGVTALAELLETIDRYWHRDAQLVRPDASTDSAGSW